MTAQQFDIKLKADSVNYRFSIEGNYIVFDKKADLNYQITPNFKLKELLTKNSANSYTKLSKSVILKLQRIREACGFPLRVTSTYRDVYYNKINGGASNSQHLQGNAIDVQPLSGIADHVEKLHIAGLNDHESNGGGIGLYDTFLHIDVGSKRLWDYQKKKFDDIEDGFILLATDKKRNYFAYSVIALILLLILKR